MANTDAYEWPMPVPGGSPGTWGEELNTLFDDHIETQVKANEDAAATADGKAVAAQATADAALPLTGGIMVGEMEAHSVRSETETVAGDGTLTLDREEADVFLVAPSGTSTIAFSNLPPAGKAAFLVVEVTNGGAVSLTWPGAVQWDGGEAPDLQTAGTDVLVFYTRDGGTTIYGTQAISVAA